MRPSERLSPLELLFARGEKASERSEGIKREAAFVTQLQRALAAAKHESQFERAPAP
jgi:hypothetical protein